MLTSARTARTGRRVLKPSHVHPVVQLPDLRLARRLLAPQADEADATPGQIHLTAHQAVGPDLTQLPALPQHRHPAERVAPPQVDQPATRPLLQVQLPALGEGAAV